MKRIPWSAHPKYMDRLREATGVEPEEHSTRPLFMSWEAVREMAESGMEIGGHTRTHVSFYVYTTYKLINAAALAACRVPASGPLDDAPTPGTVRGQVNPS